MSKAYDVIIAGTRSPTESLSPVNIGTIMGAVQ
jgi:hypothetical protein